MIVTLSSLEELSFQQPPHPNLKVSVIVPAKDEACYIRIALDALRKQTDELGNPIAPESYEVLVLANNCSDATFEICSEYCSQFPSFQLRVKHLEIPSKLAHIGTVRRLLMDAAYQRLMLVVGGGGIIVSTDADSEVDTQWIYQILREINAGADVVGGRILSRDTPTLSRVHHLRDVTYRFLKARLECELDPCPFNPWPRHHQCFGASLAVTCATYERGGRLPAVPYLEDEAFRKAVNRIDAKIRHSPKVVVYTSSRLLGKVEVGFSGQLKEWETMSLNQQQQLEESFECVKYQLILKSQLRRLWKSSKNGEQMEGLDELLAYHIGMGCNELRLLLNNGEYFESIWEQLHQHLLLEKPDYIILQPVVEAILAFRAYFAGKQKKQIELSLIA